MTFVLSHEMNLFLHPIFPRHGLQGLSAPGPVPPLAAPRGVPALAILPPQRGDGRMSLGGIFSSKRSAAGQRCRFAKGSLL